MENPNYLTSELITYIGNKRSLLPFIENGVKIVKESLGKDKLNFLDLFAGSGVVSRFMKQHSSRIYCNDLENYSKIINECYLSNSSEIERGILQKYLEWLNLEMVNKPIPGFISEMYSPIDDNNIQKGERVFYSRRNAEYIDSARNYINFLPEKLKKYFLAPLLIQSSIHTNTSGVFKGFYKNRSGIGEFGGEGKNALNRILGNIEINLPTLSNYSSETIITQMDAVKFSENIDEEFDLVYLDPPYNQHPYGSNYFMLNLIADYEKPISYSSISGIPENWNRSSFNKKNLVKESLFSIVENIKSKFFLISYNSEGFISKDEFITELGKFGKLTTLETEYNTFRGSRNLHKRSNYVTEFLFLLEK